MSRRQLALDTETTGLEVERGHRLIEVALVELVDRRLSGREWRWYINPGRPVDEGAFAVHGISDEFLADKPRFSDIADELLGLIEGAELIIHNASFDLGFLDAEIRRIDQTARVVRERADVLDTLALARELHPGQRNSLDALCKRHGVDNSGRKLHGALLDAALLADVYLAMTSGQTTLEFVVHAPPPATGARRARPIDVTRLKVMLATPEELGAHEARLVQLDKASRGHCLWRRWIQGALDVQNG